jgi:hypothetical protein
MAAIFIAPALLLGCGSNGGDGPGAAPPTPTSIPIGAPAAEGVRFDPAAPPPSQNATGIQQKINPTPETSPGPFGTMPPDTEDEDDEPAEPVPPVKSKGGTKL